MLGACRTKSLSNKVKQFLCKGVQKIWKKANATKKYKSI